METGMMLPSKSDALQLLEPKIKKGDVKEPPMIEKSTNSTPAYFDTLRKKDIEIQSRALYFSDLKASPEQLVKNLEVLSRLSKEEQKQCTIDSIALSVTSVFGIDIGNFHKKLLNTVHAKDFATSSNTDNDDGYLRLELPPIPQGDVDLRLFGHMGLWIDKMTNSKHWRVNDISDRSSYVGKSYGDSMVDHFTSLKGSAKEAMQKKVDDYCNGLDRYGKSCVVPMLSVSQDLYYHRLECTNDVHSVLYSRMTDKSWRDFYCEWNDPIPFDMTRGGDKKGNGSSGPGKEEVEEEEEEEEEEESTLEGLEKKHIPNMSLEDRISINLQLDESVDRYVDTLTKQRLLALAASGTLQSFGPTQLEHLANELDTNPTHILDILKEYDLPDYNLIGVQKTKPSALEAEYLAFKAEQFEKAKSDMERAKSDVAVYMAFYELTLTLCNNYDSAILESAIASGNQSGVNVSKSLIGFSHKSDVTKMGLVFEIAVMLYIYIKSDKYNGGDQDSQNTHVPSIAKTTGTPHQVGKSKTEGAVGPQPVGLRYIRDKLGKTEWDIGENFDNSIQDLYDGLVKKLVTSKLGGEDPIVSGTLLPEDIHEALRFYLDVSENGNDSKELGDGVEDMNYAFMMKMIQQLFERDFCNILKETCKAHYSSDSIELLAVEARSEKSVVPYIIVLLSDFTKILKSDNGYNYNYNYHKDLYVKATTYTKNLCGEISKKKEPTHLPEDLVELKVLLQGLDYEIAAIYLKQTLAGVLMREFEEFCVNNNGAKSRDLKILALLNNLKKFPKERGSLSWGAWDITIREKKQCAEEILKEQIAQLNYFEKSIGCDLTGPTNILSSILNKKMTDTPEGHSPEKWDREKWDREERDIDDVPFVVKGGGKAKKSKKKAVLKDSGESKGSKETEPGRLSKTKGGEKSKKKESLVLLSSSEESEDSAEKSKVTEATTKVTEATFLSEPEVYKLEKEDNKNRWDDLAEKQSIEHGRNVRWAALGLPSVIRWVGSNIFGDIGSNLKDMFTSLTKPNIPDPPLTNYNVTRTDKQWDDMRLSTQSAMNNDFIQRTNGTGSIYWCLKPKKEHDLVLNEHGELACTTSYMVQMQNYHNGLTESLRKRIDNHTYQSDDARARYIAQLEYLKKKGDDMVFYHRLGSNLDVKEWTGLEPDATILPFPMPTGLHTWSNIFMRTYQMLGDVRSGKNWDIAPEKLLDDLQLPAEHGDVADIITRSGAANWRYSSTDNPNSRGTSGIFTVSDLYDWTGARSGLSVFKENARNDIKSPPVWERVVKSAGTEMRKSKTLQMKKTSVAAMLGQLGVETVITGNLLRTSFVDHVSVATLEYAFCTPPSLGNSQYNTTPRDVAEKTEHLRHSLAEAMMVDTHNNLAVANTYFSMISGGYMSYLTQEASLALGSVLLDLTNAYVGPSGYMFWGGVAAVGAVSIVYKTLQGLDRNEGEKIKEHESKAISGKSKAGLLDSVIDSVLRNVGWCVQKTPSFASNILIKLTPRFNAKYLLGVSYAILHSWRMLNLGLSGQDIFGFGISALMLALEEYKHRLQLLCDDFSNLTFVKADDDDDDDDDDEDHLYKRNQWHYDNGQLSAIEKKLSDYTNGYGLLERLFSAEVFRDKLADLKQDFASVPMILSDEVTEPFDPRLYEFEARKLAIAKIAKDRLFWVTGFSNMLGVCSMRMSAGIVHEMAFKGLTDHSYKTGEGLGSFLGINFGNSVNMADRFNELSAGSYQINTGVVGQLFPVVNSFVNTFSPQNNNMFFSGEARALWVSILQTVGLTNGGFSLKDYYRLILEASTVHKIAIGTTAYFSFINTIVSPTLQREKLTLHAENYRKEIYKKLLVAWYEHGESHFEEIVKKPSVTK